VREKSPGDWVTAADVASEERRCARYSNTRRACPCSVKKAAVNAPTSAGWSIRSTEPRTSCTASTAVGVSVGLVSGGEPVVGVVHAPLLSRTYAARKGGGAFRDERRIHVSARSPDQAIVATGFPSGARSCGPDTSRCFDAAIHRFEDLRRVGGASLDLCWTAEGVFDGYFELRLGPWDVAAGAVIVREAGGMVSDWDGDGSSWLATGNILAGPPSVHAVLAKMASDST